MRVFESEFTIHQAKQVISSSDTDRATEQGCLRFTDIAVHHVTLQTRKMFLRYRGVVMLITMHIGKAELVEAS